MIYEQYSYNIYNPNYVNSTYLQQIQTQCQQMDAQKKISDMVKAVSDYCNAARGLEPAYQPEAIAACLTEIARQADIDRQRNGGGWQ